MPAGVHSVKQSISHEPSFTRKRRVHDSDSQIVHEGILRHGGESTAMNNEVCACFLHANIPACLAQLPVEGLYTCMCVCAMVCAAM